jgi:hypothetical protein
MRSVFQPARPQAAGAGETLIAQLAWATAAGVVLALLFVASTYFLAIVATGFTVAAWVILRRENEISRDFRVSLDAASLAVFDAMRDTGFGDGESSERTVTERLVSGRGARIRIEQHPGAVSRVRIRVGLFPTPDNRRRGALLVERIEHHVLHETTTKDVAS